MGVARRSTLAFAAGITLLVLGLFYYWFAVADRYGVFLYGHLAATAFDAVTSSRYWMAGLVASGIVLLITVPLQWLMARIGAARGVRYAPPPWWHVWVACAAPVAVGILWITMRANSPTLPLPLALACVAATWVGLALALAPGALVAQHPGDAMWIAWISVGLLPILLLVRAMELPSRGTISVEVATMVVTASIAIGLLWILLWLSVYKRRRKATPSPQTVITAALIFAYLLLPLLHYWVFTPPAFRYISTASNFFAYSPLVQALTYGVAMAVLALVYRLLFGRGVRVKPLRRGEEAG